MDAAGSFMVAGVRVDRMAPGRKVRRVHNPSSLGWQCDELLTESAEAREVI
jgi:hypothetical protein